MSTRPSRRRLTAAALPCLLLGGLAWAPSPSTTAPGASVQAAALAQSTPIIDPEPVPDPVFLPALAKAHDPRLPEPLPSTHAGYLAELRALGRERCAPASHVLLDRPEGALGAEALAVLRRARGGPNLDLYAGAYVEVFGLADHAPAECQILTPWLIEVTAIKEVEPPPPVLTRPRGSAR